MELARLFKAFAESSASSPAAITEASQEINDKGKHQTPSATTWNLLREGRTIQKHISDTQGQRELNSSVRQSHVSGQNQSSTQTTHNTE